MGDETDYEHPRRPSTAQPPPQHVPGDPSVHDLVSADLCRSWLAGQAWPLLFLLAERRAFGLAKYGTPLQLAEPNRRPEMDLLEELADALVYAYRAKAHRVPLAGLIYWYLRILAVLAARRWYPT